MKRILKTIFFILLLVAVIICIMWLVARNKAEKAGYEKPTFKEFLSRDATVRQQEETPSGSLGEDTPSGTNNSSSGVGAPSGTPVATNVAVSQFTSGPLSPAEGVNADGVVGVGVGGTGVAAGGVTVGSGDPVPTGTPITTTGTTTTPTPTAPVCGDADLNINFTAEELSRLTALQNEFLAIADTLHTDGDAQAEIANYTLFKAKADQAVELYNYCQSKGYQIQSPAVFKNRISTPFWRTSSDRRGYLTNGQWQDVIDPRDVYDTQSVLEQIFKVNLW